MMHINKQNTNITNFLIPLWIKVEKKKGVLIDNNLYVIVLTSGDDGLLIKISKSSRKHTKIDLLSFFNSAFLSVDNDNNMNKHIYIYIYI